MHQLAVWSVERKVIDAPLSDLESPVSQVSDRTARAGSEIAAERVTFRMPKKRAHHKGCEQQDDEERGKDTQNAMPQELDNIIRCPGLRDEVAADREEADDGDAAEIVLGLYMFLDRIFAPPAKRKRVREDHDDR
jgi:hypothetical protein